MLVFKRWLTEGIAQLSYLIGDDATQTAAVIDPRPDVQIYLDEARRLGLSITHIFETHIHADFMSGARELAHRLGDSVIYTSGEDDTDYGFECKRVHHGDTFQIGDVLLRVRATPGHTPEHVAYEICQVETPDTPWGVFTGDSLFVDSAGRPDLLGDDQTDELVEKLYHTLTEYYLSLDDGVLIFPCHGKGSACGPDIGDRLSSSIGFERQHNRFLRYEDLEMFRQAMTSDAPPVPTHYPRLKKVNRDGPPLVHAGPNVPALTPDAFRARLHQDGVQLVDARDMLAFGGAHIPKAINLGINKPEMTVFAGWVLDPEKPILLVLDRDEDIQRATRLLIRTGFTDFAGYLAGGMIAWNNNAGEIEHVIQMQAREVENNRQTLQVLDVRQDDEWQGGHIPGAKHHFVARLNDDGDDPEGIDRSRPVLTYCTTGYRASLAASLLKRRGYEDVRNLPGSWKAWRAAELPVEEPVSTLYANA